MKLNLIAILAIMLLFPLSLSAQQQDGQDVAERAAQETERLQRTLKLDDGQAFYVDSTLQHDLGAIVAEFEKMQASKISNVSLYQEIQDKWMDQIDATYKKIFTEEQWTAYLKTAGKAIKAREKRRAKAAGNNGKKK